MVYNEYIFALSKIIFDLLQDGCNIPKSGRKTRKEHGSTHARVPFSGGKGYPREFKYPNMEVLAHGRKRLPEPNSLIVGSFQNRGPLV